MLASILILQLNHRDPTLTTNVTKCWVLLLRNCARSVLNMLSYSKEMKWGLKLYTDKETRFSVKNIRVKVLRAYQLHLRRDLLLFYCGLQKWHRPELLLRICRQVIQFAINMSALSTWPAPWISNSLCSQPPPLQIHAHRAGNRGINEWHLCMWKVKIQTDKWREGESRGICCDQSSSNAMIHSFASISFSTTKRTCGEIKGGYFSAVVHQEGF